MPEFDLLSLLQNRNALLFRFNFQDGTSVFHPVKESWPPEHVEQVQRNPPLAIIRIDDLLAFGARLAPLNIPVHFIWITEYNGSTLFAKALHKTGRFYLYNEPHIFADLAMEWRRILAGCSSLSREQWHSLLEIALRFTAERSPAGLVPLVKEWPLTDLIAPKLLQVSSNSRGIVFHASLKNYLLGCLKDPVRRNTALDRVRHSLPEWRVMPPLAGLSIGDYRPVEQIALHWLIQRYTYLLSSHRRESSLVSIHSSDFYVNPADNLRRAAGFFGVDLSAEQCQTVVESDLFCRHSKYAIPYSNQARKEDHKITERQFRLEISTGLKFATRITDRFPIPNEPAPPLF